MPNELFAACQRHRAGKEKMWQHLCEIAARPLVPTLKAHDLKSEESASISNQAPYEPG